MTNPAYDPKFEKVFCPMDKAVMRYMKTVGPLSKWYDDQKKMIMRGGPVFRHFYACPECKTVVWRDYGRSGTPFAVPKQR